MRDRSDRRISTHYADCTVFIHYLGYMKEKKFKIWDTKRKEMSGPFDISEIAQGMHGVDDVVWLQYIGRKDTNGKEIYDGDILRRAKDGDNYHFYIVVEYKNGSFGGSTRPGFNHYLTANEWGRCDSDGGGYDEVIGNIHENPELLKTEEEALLVDKSPC